MIYNLLACCNALAQLYGAVHDVLHQALTEQVIYGKQKLNRYNMTAAQLADNFMHTSQHALLCT